MSSSISSSPKRQALAWAVLVLAVLEAFQFTFYRNRLGDYASAVVLYLTAVALCIVAGVAVRHQVWPAQLRARAAGRSRWWPVTLAAAGGIWLCVPLLKSRFAGTHPQDYSDIIPAITVYCQRLLAGEVVHQPLTENLGYFLEPGYLPATWFPFVVPELLRFDYRWMSCLSLLVGLIGYWVIVQRLQRPPVVAFGLSLLPPLLVYSILYTNGDIFAITVEPLIVGYYLLLVAGVLLPSRPLQAAALVLCLLSRFSLVFWVPLYLGLLYVGESRRWAWSLAGLGAAGVLLLYVLPVLSHDWGLFMRVQAVYTETTLGEWRHLDERGLPLHLYNGIGLTNFFYHFVPGDVLARLKLAKLVHLAALLVLVGSTAVAYWRQRLPRTDYRLYAVIVLKLYLATFYALLQVPYAYLAMVSFFVSCYLVVLAVGPASAVASSATAEAGPVL
jgi:hypothetical protein